MDIMEAAKKALALMNEGAELVGKVSAAIKGGVDGLKTGDQDKLDKLLAEATQRRRDASAELEEALKTLK